MQSGDPWLSDATCSLSTEEFEAFMSDSHGHLFEEDASTTQAWVDILMNDDRDPFAEPPTKKRRLAPAQDGEGHPHPQEICENDHESRAASLGAQTSYQSPARSEPCPSPQDSGYSSSIADASHVHSPDLQKALGQWDSESIVEEPTRAVIQADNHYPQMTIKAHEVQPKDNPHLRDMTWDADVPVPSIEISSVLCNKAPAWLYAATGHTAPVQKKRNYWTKEQAQQLEEQMRFFAHQKRHSQEKAVAPPRGDIGTAKQFNYHNTTAGSISTFSKSLLLSISLAISNPEDHSSILHLINELQATIISSGTQKIPAQLQQTLDSLHCKWGKDAAFRKSVLLWTMQMLETQSERRVPELCRAPLNYRPDISNEMEWAGDVDLDEIKSVEALKSMLRAERVKSSTLYKANEGLKGGLRAVMDELDPLKAKLQAAEVELQLLKTELESSRKEALRYTSNWPAELSEQECAAVFEADLEAALNDVDLDSLFDESLV